MGTTGSEGAANTVGRGRLGEVAALFLRLGITAFGGPAAHIAMMRDEVVRRRGWVDDQTFLDMVGATNVIPGPNSTEMAIHLGYRRAGPWGLATAGALFILPAALITVALAVLYVHFQANPQLGWLLYGVKPVIIAVILHAVWGLGRRAFATIVMALVGIAVFALYLAGVNELLLLFAGAAAAAGTKTGLKALRARGPVMLLAPVGGAWGALALPSGAATFSLATLFLNFLKIGSVLYGSGYVLLAFLRADFVERLGWLTERQLLDAVAIGQATPGPVLSTATFVGYVIGGVPAAVLATVAIFLPSFLFVAALGKLLPLVRRSEWLGAALDGVNAASLGLMAGVAWQLGRASIDGWFTALLGVAAVAMVFATRVNSLWLLLAGGGAGVLYRLAQP